MSYFIDDKYLKAKKWIANQIEYGESWEDIIHLDLTRKSTPQSFEELKDELYVPVDMNESQWCLLVEEQKASYFEIVEVQGIAQSDDTESDVITGSCWEGYKSLLDGSSSGKARMTQESIAYLERHCEWIVRRLKFESSQTGPVKGLVMGSVQSGKTSNMIGVVSMAADNDWNFFIILSGTIENLRKQTRDRFFSDLNAAGGLVWHVLDQTRKREHMADIQDISTSADIRNAPALTVNNLRLNPYRKDSYNSQQFFDRYLTVCLKNSTRLRNLIDWLHSNKAIGSKMRIVIIDDEADQAGINTKKMGDETNEELIERTTVNQLLVNLVSGRRSDGSESDVKFQSINYISYTATPYANVLNESLGNSLYPRNFISSLPEAKEYFGVRVIFGSNVNAEYPGMDIVRDIPENEMVVLKELHEGEFVLLPKSYKKSVSWFLCSAALLRLRGYKKPISMLIHTTNRQVKHKAEYEAINAWLSNNGNMQDFINICKDVYNSEKNRFTLSDLKIAYPDYSGLDDIDDQFPCFDIIKGELKQLVSEVVSIELDEDKEAQFRDDAVHICVDNSVANKWVEQGSVLRMMYPSQKQLRKMEKAPVFIVLGGNTLSRGLTIEGLLCTYFARNTNQADTLMQMGRWFGYRKGYELLQRMWMPSEVRKKFELLSEIDEALKNEFERYAKMGLSPAEFGPRVMSSARIQRFLLSSKNKMQGAEAVNLDYSGDSYETTEFMNDPLKLKSNIDITQAFLAELPEAQKSDLNESAFVWRDVPSTYVLESFFAKYHIFENSKLHSNIPMFIDWLDEMNAEAKFVQWNIGLIGKQKAESNFEFGEFSVGKVDRSKKRREDSNSYIDIGSLRDGGDILCDVDVTTLTHEQKQVLKKARSNRKNLNVTRSELGLETKPLLLLYCIDKNLGQSSDKREPIGTEHDIVGFSIIIPADTKGKSYAIAYRIKHKE